MDARTFRGNGGGAGRRLACLLVGGGLVAAMLAGCGPGSGGSGIPGPSGSAPPASTPAPGPAPSPVPSPLQPPASCAVPSEASDASYGGTVRALQADCLLVGDRSILITDAVIVGRSGASVTAADLVAGVPVTIEPRAADPGRAARVTIEDR